MRRLANVVARSRVVTCLRWVSMALLLVAGAGCSKTKYDCMESKGVCTCVPGAVAGGRAECTRTYQCCVEWRRTSILPDDPYTGSGCNCYDLPSGESCVSTDDKSNREQQFEVVSRPKICPPPSLF